MIMPDTVINVLSIRIAAKKANPAPRAADPISGYGKDRRGFPA